MAYVYGHYKADTNELFYIGKGMGKRAYQKTNRNIHWKRVVKKHGLVVKILEDDLTEEQAYEKEKQLIAEVGLENLTNIVEGGKGMTSSDAQRLAKKREEQNPEWRHNVANGITQKYATSEEYRKKMKDAGKKRLQNEEWKKNVVEAHKKLAQDPEWRKKQTEVNRKLAQDREWRRKNAEANRKLAQNPEWIKKNKDNGKKCAQDPEWRRKQREGIRKYWEQKKALDNQQ